MAYITNRSVRQNYEILDTVRAGLSLMGTEAKSIRDGKGSLAGARVLIRGGEAFLTGATIPPYQPNNTEYAYIPDRNRRLLLSKQEIHKLNVKSEEKNLTLVPLTVYNCNRRLKLDIGVARKKNARDKREAIKKRDSKKSIRQHLLQH